MIDKYLRHPVLPEGSRTRTQPCDEQEMERLVETPQTQAHEILGGRAFALRQEMYTPFLVMNNLLGGPAMNSRLNLNIREKHGLSYNINSFYTPYLDSGIWGIYYACEPKNLGRIRKLVTKELNQLSSAPLGTLQLNQAKKQLSGQMILGYENLLTQMLSMAQDLLDFGRIISFEEYLSEIEAVTSTAIQGAAKQVFKDQPVSKITYMQTA